MRLLLLMLMLSGCSDKYVTYENRIIDAAGSSVPMYFYANAMPNYDSANTWYPDFIYYIYQIEEGEYDAYFHAYLITDDSISWAGTTEITMEHGKKIQGYYSAVNTVWLPPEYLERTTPMAYVSVEYE